MTIARADFIEGIAKGMAVLESFDTERQRLNATLAAERAGLTRAAARRHLLTLAHLGYLETRRQLFLDGAQGAALLGELPGLVAPAARAAAHAEPARGADRRILLGRGARWRGGGDRGAQRQLRHAHARCWPTACTWARGCRPMPPPPAACCWPRCRRPSSRAGSRAATWRRLTPQTTTQARALRQLVTRARARKTIASRARSTSSACRRWPCRCATCRATRWPRSTWCCRARATRRRPCGATCCRCCSRPRAEVRALL